MKSSNVSVRQTLGAITVRVALPAEAAAFDAQLATHHYLGAGRPVGDYLRQFVERDGVPVALLVWEPSCYSLKDRDRSIGWRASQRVARLKLIVQNRRFLVLTPKGQSANLASQAMGAALRALPDHWGEAFGYGRGSFCRPAPRLAAACPRWPTAIGSSARQLLRKHTGIKPTRRSEFVGSFRKRRRAEIIAPSCLP
jgi:hypothetical protein